MTKQNKDAPISKRTMDVKFCIHDRSIALKKDARELILHSFENIPYKQIATRVSGLTAMDLRSDLDNSEPGEITFPSKGTWGNVAVGWIVGRRPVFDKLQGQLKKRVESYNVVPFEPKELELKLLEELNEISDRWGSEKNLNQRQAVEGALYQALRLINGKGPLGYRMVPVSDDDHNDRCMLEGVRPYPNNRPAMASLNPLFIDKSPAEEYLIRTRGYGEPLGYGVTVPENGDSTKK